MGSGALVCRMEPNPKIRLPARIGGVVSIINTQTTLSYEACAMADRQPQQYRDALEDLQRWPWPMPTRPRVMEPGG